MSSPLPKFCYVGVDSKGRLELVVSEYKLHPVGARILQGGTFPDEVFDLYDSSKEISEHTILAAISGLEALLRGETVTQARPEFGASPAKPRRKRT